MSTVASSKIINIMGTELSLTMSESLKASFKMAKRTVLESLHGLMDRFFKEDM